MENNIYLQSLKQGIKTIFDIGENQETNAYKQAEGFLNIGKLAPEGGYLANIFAKIYGNEQSFFHLKPLDLEKETFEPKSKKKGDFEQLKTDFKKEFDKIPPNSLETLFYLLKKYLSFVPVNKDHTHINAFEFLKLRSAFAQCLYDFEQEKPEGNLPFLMLCIDISGIQGFIYNIASGKAAKSLKGRSFYLQLLMDSLIQRVIKDTKKASIGHVIYASGGKAYLLLPNLESVRNAIEGLEKEVERKIFEEHKESLYVLMDWVEFDEKQKNNIAELWKRLGDKTAKKKYRKYQELLTKDFDKFFEPNDEDGFDTKDTNKTVCAVTGELVEIDPKNEKRNLLKKTDDGEKIWVKESVLKQAELGKQLKETQFYITYQGGQGDKSLSEKARYYAINPVNLEILSYIKNEKDFIAEHKKIGAFASIKYSLVRKINSTNFLAEDTLNGQGASYGFTFYGGNEQAYLTDKDKNKDWNYVDRKGNIVPEQDRLEKDYEELTGLENEEDKGFRRLGILRMDVDELGRLFADKMKKNNLQNFPAYAMVSAHLENFFAGYLNEIRDKGFIENPKKEKEYYKDWVNILYSGGDDVFAVGRWDLILEFAHEIQDKFKKFVGDNPTLSAGVAMIGGKFPISKGAELAGEAEDKAKKFGENKACKIPAQKNAIGIFGEVVSWSELEYIKEIKEKLIEFDKIISAGFRQKLITFQATKNKHLKFKDFDDHERQKPDLSYKWHSAYFIARLAKELKGKKDDKSKQAHEVLLTFQEDLQEPEKAYQNRLGKKGLKYDKESLQKFLAEMQKNLFISDRNFDLYAIASRWAGLILRTEKNK